MTPAQGEILKTLFELRRQLGPERYWRPRDLGAYRSSHHALTLKRLQERGLVERLERDADSTRPSFAYRITPEGEQAWVLFKDMADMPVHAVFGGQEAAMRMNIMASVAS